MKWKWKLDNDSIGKAVAQAEKEAEKVGMEGGHNIAADKHHAVAFGDAAEIVPRLVHQSCTDDNIIFFGSLNGNGNQPYPPLL